MQLAERPESFKMSSRDRFWPQGCCIQAQRHPPQAPGMLYQVWFEGPVLQRFSFGKSRVGMDLRSDGRR